MKVILKEDVKNLGEEGDIVDVKNGYARNFLLPRGMVVPCTVGNLSILSQQKNAIEKRKAAKREEAKSLKEKIEALTLTLGIAAGDTGKLFGSVNNATIADALEAKGISVERKKIEIVGTHVKMVGSYAAKVRLYGDEVASLKFIVEGVKTTSTTKDAKKAEAASEQKVDASEAPAANAEAASESEVTASAE